MPETRAVTPEDDSLLQAMYTAMRAEEVSRFGWGREQQDAFVQMQHQLQRRAYAMQFPGSDPLIILHEGMAAGQFLVFRQADQIRLVDIAVLPRFQGAGLGSAIIRELQAEAAQSGRSVALRVRRENDGARRLYERLGFALSGESDTDYHMVWRPPAGATPRDHHMLL